MLIVVLNLLRLDLTLDGVIFQQNGACILIKADTTIEVSIHITNSSFLQNGNFLSSVLLLNCEASSTVCIQIRNCTFKENFFEEYGVISIINLLGTTNLAVDKLRMEENSLINPSDEQDISEQNISNSEAAKGLAKTDTPSESRNSVLLNIIHCFQESCRDVLRCPYLPTTL